MGFRKVTFCAGLLATAALVPLTSPAHALARTYTSAHAPPPAHAAFPASPAIPGHATPPGPAAPPARAAHPASPASSAYVTDDASGLTVTPGAPPPGSAVGLRLADCAARTAIAVSSVFVADVRLTASGGVLTGEGRIRSTVAAGTHDVRVACGDTGRIGTITVGKEPARRPPRQPDPVPPPEPADPGKPAGPREPATPPAPARPDTPAAPASPVAPVEAGGGGTAKLAAGSRGDGGGGPGTGHVVTGLVLASVAAGAVALGGLRRRNRGSG